MATNRPLLIVNPRSGGGLSEAQWARLAGPIAQGLGAFDTVHTERPGHARGIARQAATQGRRLVVAVGGDGTLNEVVNGLMDAGAPRTTELALLPRGTGGDFRRTIDLPADLAKASAYLAKAPGRPIDVGLVHFTDHQGATASRHFINVSSFGFSAAVANKANESNKKLGARAAFLGATLRTVIGYDNLDVQIAVDGAAPVRRTVLLGAVGNGRYFGGGMKICPEATLDSGRLNLVVVGDLGLGSIATKIHRLYAGTHLSIKRIEGRNAQRVHVASATERNAPVEVDGETPGTLPATWEIIPGALLMRL